MVALDPDWTLLNAMSRAFALPRKTAFRVVLAGGVMSWFPATRNAEAADPQPYVVTVKPTGQADLDAAMQASSSLVTLKKTKAVGPFALAGRIRGDADRVNNALESLGYYAGHVSLQVGIKEQGGKTLSGDDPNLPTWLESLPKGQTASVTISAERGPVFSIGTITLEDAPPTPPPAPASGQASQTTPKAAPVSLTPMQAHAFGLQPGQPAVAATVLAAQNALLNDLQEEGHATATVSAPRAYLQPASHTLNLVFQVHLGPIVDIGPISFDGLSKVHQAFLRRRLLLHPGELYQPSKIEAARQDLASVGVFASVGVRNLPPPVPLASIPGLKPSDGIDQAMPLAFDFTEAKRHTVSAQLGYSTDLGGRVGASWTHHNLFGNAEQLRLTALITGLGGSAQQGLGYDVYADYTKPDFLSRNQSFAARVEGVRQYLYSYHQTALLARAGINRKLGRYWNVAASLSAEQESIRQFGDTRSYFIASIPLNANFDNTDLTNPIDPATHGVRLAVSVTPSESLEHQSSFFTLLSAVGSTYFDLNKIGLTRPGRSVIAVRGILGSVQGASTYQIPPDQRLYGGGPATIRGFRYQGVGPQFPGTKYAIGGTSLDAGSLEFRQRIGKSFGTAAFADAGQVGSGSAPFTGKLRVGVGGGVRYFTPIGPIRVDVAVPMNRPPKGDKWELYIGLGENF